MKKFILLMMLFSFAGGLPANELEQVRKLYQTALRLSVEEHCHTMTMRVVYAAIGPQITTVNFFHVARQINPERDPYAMAFDLALVTVTWNVAASVNYRREYLFNRSGALIFCFDQKNKSENRYYWSGGKLFRMESREPAGGRITQKTVVRDFSKPVVDRAARIIQKAAEYSRLFKTVVLAEKLK